MCFEVAGAVAEVEPDALIEDAGAELLGGGEVEEGGNDGNFFVGRDGGEGGFFEAVDAGEAVRAGCGSEFLMDVDDTILLGIEGDVARGDVVADGEGDGAARMLMAFNECGEGNGGKNVAVVDEEGSVFDPRE